ncbi:hypothetical protein BV898_04493 [Hypsibius exemplaris]|uniref:Uncharacterized protein n=1 Tax=Hypsibius exemplaris TaxID=2072580 RepID=A0A1W0X2G7_HYPEX|nr:hypothetical protein BV898_04493 [Hypsibius exemplaris]
MPEFATVPAKPWRSTRGLYPGYHTMATAFDRPPYPVSGSQSLRPSFFHQSDSPTIRLSDRPSTHAVSWSTITDKSQTGHCPTVRPSVHPMPSLRSGSPRPYFLHQLTVRPSDRPTVRPSDRLIVSVKRPVWLPCHSLTINVNRLH